MPQLQSCPAPNDFVAYSPLQLHELASKDYRLVDLVNFVVRYNDPEQRRIDQSQIHTEMHQLLKGEDLKVTLTGRAPDWLPDSFLSISLREQTDGVENGISIFNFWLYGYPR